MTGILLLIGATSDIGHAVAARYAREGWRIRLAARDPERARRNRDDLVARFQTEVTIHVLDLLDAESFSGFVASLPELPDTVVCVAGELGDQIRSQAESTEADRIMRVNYLGPSLLLGVVAERFVARGYGTLVGISSVAGDRGRASNYVYGSAKAGFSAFLSGLRQRLAPTGLHVVTVKPGFVRTRMTEGLRLPPIVTAQPDEVAAAVYLAAEMRKRGVVYVRPVWRPIMAIIRALPEPVFTRLRM